MESLEIFGVLLVILGVTGIAVMLKSGRPDSRSTTESPNSK